jgi:GT2 family glycosyltransferase
MPLSISVIIPAYNEQENIFSCLESLICQKYPSHDYEIIVVDNESTDSTPEIAKNFEVQLLARQPGNVGRVRNLGAQHAQGTILAFIDADCVVDPDWISRAIQLSTEYPTTVFGGGCLLPDNPTIVEKYWLLGNSETRLPKDLIGASIVLKKDVFEKIGGFDESVTSGEDTALSKEASKLGLPISITSALSVVHLGNAKTLKEFSKRQVWHGANYLKELSKSLKDPTFIFILLSIASLALATLILVFAQTRWPYMLIGIFFTIPAVFSIKRIVRSRVIPSLKALPVIYTLDFIYVQARSYSILKSFFR